MDTFLAAVSKQMSSTGPVLTSLTQQRLTHDLFEDWTNADDENNDNPLFTEQNFIDAWYSELQSIGGPYPNNTDLAVEYYDRIAAWTGTCDEGIPYNNTADFVSLLHSPFYLPQLTRSFQFQYSSTHNGTDSS